MTPDLDPIRARLAAATPGPWHSWDRGIGYEVHKGRAADCLSEYGVGMESCTELNDGFRGTFRMADADLIANAPADLAALVAEVERLREAVERVRALADNPYPDVRNIQGMELLRALDSTRTAPTICTDLTAAWCPIHGDCVCDREESMDDRRCPLHSFDSLHALDGAE